MIFNIPESDFIKLLLTLSDKELEIYQRYLKTLLLEK